MTNALQSTWMLIGDWTIARARPLLAMLSAQRCLPAMSMPVAIATAESQREVVDAVLVLQSVPDEFSASEIDRLIGHLPLAHWAICVGEWCDSIGRTEQHWPIGWCVPLRDAESRMAILLERIASGAAPLAPTASRDEAFAFAAQLDVRAKVQHSRPAHVAGDDPQTVETLRDLLRFEGAVVRGEPCDGLNVIAVTVPTAAALSRIVELRLQQPNSEIWIATDLVTPEQSQSIQRAGANRVVSQLRFCEALSGI